MFGSIGKKIGGGALRPKYRASGMKDRSRRNIPFDYIERVGQTQLTDWAVIRNRERFLLDIRLALD